MQISRLWSTALAEMRSCRRLVRTWVIAVLAMLCAALVWLFLSLSHMFFSYVSASAGLSGPQFAIFDLGRMTLLCFTIGIVFLAFDVRQRDVRDRIGDAIAVRPMSNFELLLGRLIGIVLLLAIPALTLIVLMNGYGLLAEVFNLGFGSVMDPTSVMAFVIWDIGPNLLFWGALTMLVAVVARNRMLVVAVMLVLLFGYYSLSSQIPFFLGSALSTYIGSDSFPSAVAPQFFAGDVVLNRMYVILLAIGLLGLASAIYPRQAKLQERQIYGVTGCSAVVIAIFGIYALVNSKLLELDQVDDWAAVHKQFETHSATNIETVSGLVEIYPGRSIHLDLVLKLTPSASGSANEWLFSLNPGYKIVEIELNGKKTQDYEFKNGLLSVPRHSINTPPRELRLVAKGKPDPMFAYLDSSLKWKDLNFTEALAAKRFGTKSYIFHPQFVVLVPGMSWFPSSGAAYGQTNWEIRQPDFFLVDLQVSVPKHWIVAGPGSRSRMEGEDRARFRFNPKNFVSEVALIASNFERRTLVVESTTFELLLSKKHTKNLDTLNEVVPALESWISERMTKLKELGLSLPYDTLSFVEVPHTLRTYGGGWMMESVFSPPGIQMFRESGLPIARFDYAIDNQVAELTDDEEKLGEFMLELLQDYFENDFEGGNLFQSLGSNIVSHQTRATGAGAAAMNHLVALLANKLVSARDGYFSIHTATTGNRAAELTSSMRQAGGTFGAVPDIEKMEWRKYFVDRPSVWEQATNTALSNFDFDHDPKNAFHALMLKTDAYTTLLTDVIDEDKIGLFLRDLVIRYGGMGYTEQDFHNTALNAGVDLKHTLGNWLHSTSLPGFLLVNAKLEQLDSIDAGDSAYQTTFLIRNDETVPGYVTVSSGFEGELGYQTRTPIRVPSSTTLQVAIQTVDHPRQVVVHPYFSLNRSALRLDIVEHDDNISTTKESLPHISEVDWEPVESNSIIVDDLDATFSTIGGEDSTNRSLLPKWIGYLFGAYDTVLEIDRGLLQLDDALDNLSKDPFNSVMWYRDTHPSSAGKYRRTHTINFQRDDQTKLTFSADIPKPGKWRLEYHMPAIQSKSYLSKYSPGLGSIHWVGRPFGLARMQLEINNRGLSKTIKFNASEAFTGWNDLGLFDLDVGNVDVVLTPESNGRSIGDAIKWTPEQEEN